MRVVGVAVVRVVDGRSEVLAARRTAPPEAAGRWEFPGGKCEPGEGLAQAAVREVAEELGVTVAVTRTLAGVVPVRAGVSLEAVLAVLVEGEPAPLEHDELRWLGAPELRSVAWLPADVPFLDQLSDVLDGSPGTEPR